MKFILNHTGLNNRNKKKCWFPRAKTALTWRKASLIKHFNDVEANFSPSKKTKPDISFVTIFTLCCRRQGCVYKTWPNIFRDTSKFAISVKVQNHNLRKKIFWVWCIYIYIRLFKKSEDFLVILFIFSARESFLFLSVLVACCCFIICTLVPRIL